MEQVTTSQDEKKNIVYWLIERYDQQRQSLEQRAAIVLSAAAILVTGLAFLFQMVLTNSKFVSLSVFFKGIIVSLFCLGFLLLLISIIICMSVVTHIFKYSRTLIGDDPPVRYFFHFFDTLEQVRTFEDFRSLYNKSTIENLLDYALSHLWSSLHLYAHRYTLVRRAVVFLIWATPSILISALIAFLWL